MAFTVIDKKVIARNQRHRFGPQIGENNAAQFLHRIGFMFDTLGQVAVVRFSRRSQHRAVEGVFPAVIATSQSILFNDSDTEVGAAVRAIGIDQPQPPRAVPEQHQIFTQYANESGPVPEIR